MLSHHICIKLVYFGEVSGLIYISNLLAACEEDAVLIDEYRRHINQITRPMILVVSMCWLVPVLVSGFVVFEGCIIGLHFSSGLFAIADHVRYII